MKANKDTRRINFLAKIAREFRIGAIHSISPAERPGWRYCIESRLGFYNSDSFRKVIDIAIRDRARKEKP